MSSRQSAQQGGNGFPGAPTTTSNANSTAANAPAATTVDPVCTGGLNLRYIKREESEVFSIKFSVEDDYLAIACGNSAIKMYHFKAGNLLQNLVEPGSRLPCTSICFRPQAPSQSRTKNVLLAGYTDGTVRHWHATSGKKLSEFSEEDNQIFTCDFFSDGSRFVTAGSDYTLRVYDETTQDQIVALYAGKGEVTAGHSNRIFCAKFHPKDSNVIVSGGWDNTVQIWDVRMQYAVRSIFRPHICGESIDFDDTGDKILTGAYLKEDPLQIWSYATGNLIETIPWSISDERKPCMLYASQFSHGKSNNKFILAAGGGSNNEAKIFNTSLKKNQCFGVIQGFQQAVYAITLSKSETYLALGGGSRSVYVYDIENVNSTSDFVY